MNDNVTIIGIAGGTGSGKSTVVRKIAAALPPHYVAVVPLDSYYNDTTDLTEEERRAINFDHPDAFDWKLLIKQINDLRNGIAVEQPTYSYLKCNREVATVHVEPKPVIIVEGIMTLLNKKLRDMMDLKIFVDCDSDERLIRNIQRDIVERGRNVQMVLDRYLEVLKPMHEQFIEPTKRFADIIIPQGGDNIKGIGMVCSYIESIVPEKEGAANEREPPQVFGKYKTCGGSLFSFPCLCVGRLYASSSGFCCAADAAFSSCLRSWCIFMAFTHSTTPYSIRHQPITNSGALAMPCG